MEGNKITAITKEKTDVLKNAQGFKAGAGWMMSLTGFFFD